MIIEWLLLGEEASSCPAVADVNVDGTFDITDPSCLTNFLFLGGPAPEKSPVQCRPESESRPIGPRTEAVDLDLRVIAKTVLRVLSPKTSEAATQLERKKKGVVTDVPSSFS